MIGCFVSTQPNKNIYTDKTSVLDPKLFFSDLDPDPTFQEILDPDPISNPT